MLTEFARFHFRNILHAGLQHVKKVPGGLTGYLNLISEAGKRVLASGAKLHRKEVEISIFQHLRA